MAQSAFRYFSCTKEPDVLVASIKAPGLNLDEPDKEAVARIIPPVTEADMVARAAPAIAIPVAPTAPASPNANAIDLTLVGARKELTAMGFKFHDQDQFFDAARRNDFLTVRMFLAAVGISPGAPDSKGDTALRFAKEKTEMKFWLELFVEAEKKGDYPGNIAEGVFGK